MAKSTTDDYLSKLFSKYDIDGYVELFSGPHYNKQTTPKEFDHLIGPFKVTRDVKTMRTGETVVAYSQGILIPFPFSDLHRVAVSDPVDMVSAVPGIECTQWYNRNRTYLFTH